MKKKNSRWCAIILAVLCMCTSGGCASKSVILQEPEMIVADTVALASGIYDSEDIAIVVKKDTQNCTIQFQNLQTGKRYTLEYNGATTLWDKYNQPISLAQIELGSIVTTRFYKEKKQLSYIKMQPECIYYDNLSNYSLDTEKGKMTIGDVTYDLSCHLSVFSGENEVELMDINQVDVLSVWGYHNMIYGINVEKGHGYLRLKNDTYFIGGWIEVGQSVITKISEDMLLVVPEGAKTVSISQNGTHATQQIIFNRNEEMVWDLGDVEIVQPKTGNIIFTITPSEAQVTIDGANVDVTNPVELEYGVHQMTIVAEGYDTVAQYIKVAQPSANISVEMEEVDEKTEEKESKKESQTDTSDSEKESDEETQDEEAQNDETQEKQSEKLPTTSALGDYKVYIDSPESAEVYLDGNYIGIAPVSFPKKAGSYVITLRKTGYQTRSYTLQVDGEEKDVNYSFSELVLLQD